MSLENFTAALIALVGGPSDPAQPPDTVFLDELADLLGTPPVVVLSNTPMQSLSTAHRLPVLVLEQGDGETAPISEGSEHSRTIGNYSQEFASTLSLALVWREQDRDAAFIQRTRLPAIFARLLLRNPMPGGIAGAWLDSWTPDRAVNHPLHVWGCQLRGEYEIQND